MSDLFLPDGLAIEQGLHGGPATAHLALVSPICVILLQPCVQVGLQLLQRVIQFAPERNPIKFVQYRFVEALADAVCLGVTRLALGVFDAVDGQIQLVVMRLHFATVFRTPVRQHTDDAHLLRSEEGEHTIIEQLRCRDGRFGGVQLGRRPLAVRVHECLLVDAPPCLSG